MPAAPDRRSDGGRGRAAPRSRPARSRRNAAGRDAPGRPAAGRRPGRPRRRPWRAVPRSPVPAARQARSAAAGRSLAGRRPAVRSTHSRALLAPGAAISPPERHSRKGRVRPRRSFARRTSPATTATTHKGEAMNNVNMVGRLTKDPKIVERGERTICEMRVAVDNPGHQATFIAVRSFDEQAYACAEYLVKGQRVAVSGPLVYSYWKTSEGEFCEDYAVIGG